MRDNFPMICFEGCDGVGKSTVLNVLLKQLQQLGVPAMVVGQHSWLDLDTARVIMEVRRGNSPYSPEQVAQAYFVDKVAHYRRSIAPALQRAVVIADRFVLSDAVYQEVLYDIPAESTMARHRVEGTRLPDILIYVSASVEEAYARIQKRSKHMRHYERPADMRKIMATYERMLDKMPQNSTRLLRFVNDKPNYVERVREIILPLVLAACPDSVRNPEPALS